MPGEKHKFADRLLMDMYQVPRWFILNLINQLLPQYVLTHQSFTEFLAAAMISSIFTPICWAHLCSDPPPPPLCINVSYLQSRAFVWRSLTGSLPFQAQLNKKLQQVDQQLVDHLLRLKVGRYVTQSVYHSQGTVSTKNRGENIYLLFYIRGSIFSHASLSHVLLLTCIHGLCSPWWSRPWS